MGKQRLGITLIMIDKEAEAFKAAAAEARLSLAKYIELAIVDKIEKDKRLKEYNDVFR